MSPKIPVPCDMHSVESLPLKCGCDLRLWWDSYSRDYITSHGEGIFVYIIKVPNQLTEFIKREMSWVGLI